MAEVQRFKRGDRVVHPTMGYGTVDASTGHTAPGYVRVKFDRRDQGTRRVPQGTLMPDAPGVFEDAEATMLWTKGDIVHCLELLPSGPQITAHTARVRANLEEALGRCE